MKKITAILLAMILACTLLTAVVSAEGEKFTIELVYTGEYVYGSGEAEVTAELRLKNNPGICGVQFSIPITPAFKSAEVSEKGALAEKFLGQIGYREDTGIIRSAKAAYPAVEGDGTFAYITFTVDEAALQNNDDITLSITGVVLADADNKRMTDYEVSFAPLKVGCAHPEAKREVISAVEATCTKNGKEAGWKCTFCGHAEEGKEISALGHNWDEGTVTTKPTCTKMGVRTIKCTRENCDGINASYTEEIEALGHEFDKEGTVTTKPTCTKTGVRTFKCTREDCDGIDNSYTEEIEALGHKFDEEGTITNCGTASIRISASGIYFPKLIFILIFD